MILSGTQNLTVQDKVTITDLVKNHEKRNNMGVYSKEYALRYDVNIFISKYLELYGINKC